MHTYTHTHTAVLERFCIFCFLVFFGIALELEALSVEPTQVGAQSFPPKHIGSVILFTGTSDGIGQMPHRTCDPTEGGELGKMLSTG